MDNFVIIPFLNEKKYVDEYEEIKRIGKGTFGSCWKVKKKNE